MFSTTIKDHDQIEVDIGASESPDEADAEESEIDELDLFPGGLELPPMRSPRGCLFLILIWRIS